MATPPKPDPPKPDRLSKRRGKNMNDEFFETPVCPCEEVQPEPQSEYDVPGEWITYTGEVNVDVFNNAAWEAKEELDREIRAYARSEHIELRFEPSTSSEGCSPAESGPGQQDLEPSDQPLKKFSRRMRSTGESSGSEHVKPPSKRVLETNAPSAPLMEESSQGKKTEVILIPGKETTHSEHEDFAMDIDCAEATGAVAGCSGLRRAETVKIRILEIAASSSAVMSTTDAPVDEAADPAVAQPDIPKPPGTDAAGDASPTAGAENEPNADVEPPDAEAVPARPGGGAWGAYVPDDDAFTDVPDFPSPPYSDQELPGSDESDDGFPPYDPNWDIVLPQIIDEEEFKDIPKDDEVKKAPEDPK